MTQKRIAELVDLLKKTSASYYSGKSLISDVEWDEAYYELQTLDPDNPVLDEIGEAEDVEFEGFEKKEHQMFMHSQQKARNLKEFAAWLNKLPKSHNFFRVDHKLDGLSIELVYVNGKLSQALTQGEETGFNIVKHVRQMRNVSLKVNGPDGQPFTGSLRGEMIMSPQDFVEKYEPKGYVNPRAAAIGLSKKDGPHLKDVQVVLYDAAGDSIVATKHTEIKTFLTGLGGVVAESKNFTRANLLDRVSKWYEELTAKRTAGEVDFEIDGLVVKSNVIDPTDAQRAKPKFQIAIKFPPQTLTTTILDIVWQQSGATLTPVAMLEPVKLCATTVKKATLHNPSVMKTLGVKVGASVLVCKRGDIIPKVEKVTKPGKGPRPLVPVACPTCDAPTEITETGSRVFCTNVACPALLPHRIKKWMTKLEVKFFGDKLILAFVREVDPTNIFELFELDEEVMAEWNLSTADEGTKRVGLPTAKKALANLKKASKGVTTEDFLGALDIHSIGSRIFALAVEAGMDLMAIREANENELVAIKGIGPKRARQIVAGLQDLSDEIDGLLAHGVTLKQSIVHEATKGSVCFTGALSKPRKLMEVMACEGGFEIKSGVSKGLTYLVTPDPESGTKKNKDAQRLGVKVIDEAEFVRLLG